MEKPEAVGPILCHEDESGVLYDLLIEYLCGAKD